MQNAGERGNSTNHKLGQDYSKCLKIAKGWPMNSKENNPIPNNIPKRLYENTQQEFLEGANPAISASRELAKDTFSERVEVMGPDKLKYVADMLVELRKISEDLEENMVSYLIEMAILELHTVRSLSQSSGDASGKK